MSDDFKLESAEELNRFYRTPDPWGYMDNPEDNRRKGELFSLLPHCEWQRSLDIGCGNGFITFDLPGKEVIGVDFAAAAIHWAENERMRRSDAGRFAFRTSSIFDLHPDTLGKFNLVVITGVLYSQYIGRAFAIVREIVDQLLEQRGILVSCHIDEWNPPRFPYTLLDASLYPYREFTHRLEVSIK